MKQTLLPFLVFVLSFSLSSQAQTASGKSGGVVLKRIGIARIQVNASPGWKVSLADIANNNVPVFFAENSEVIKYRKQTLRDQFPPTTGDTIQELTSDSLAVYFKQDLWSMSGYDDKGGSSREKRNSIHDLPTENPLKLVADTVFDEAVDIFCHWVFQKSDDGRFVIPTIQMKMELYDRSGNPNNEKKITLLPSEIKTSHWKDAYGVSYDLVKGIPFDEIAQGGIMGNIVTDVYLQALNKLLSKRI